MTDTPAELSPTDALTVLINAARRMSGTYQEHLVIDQAVQLLIAHFQPTPEVNGQVPTRRAKTKT